MTPHPTLDDSRNVTRRRRWQPVIVRLTAIAAGIALIIVVGNLLITGGRPREANRFVHPMGYSVIRPADWEARAVFRPNDQVRDAINLMPKAWKGSEPSMWVRRLNEAPDLDSLSARGFSRGSFAGHEAWISQKKQKHDTVREAAIKVGDDWFAAGASLPGLEAAKMDMWWRYLESFQPSPADMTAQPDSATTPG